MCCMLLSLNDWILAAEPNGKPEDLPLKDFSGGILRATIENTTAKTLLLITGSQGQYNSKA